MMGRQTKADKARAAEHLETLRGILKPGDTVHTVIRHVSSSGMSRRIDLYKVEHDGPRYGTDLRFLTGYVAAVLGYRWDDRNGKHGLVVGGCGMDMGFHVVYNLARVLFPDGHGCIGEGCPSNDHSNGDRDWTPHDPDAWDTNSEMASGLDRMRARERQEQTGKRHHWHRDGGYALRQRWI